MKNTSSHCFPAHPLAVLAAGALGVFLATAAAEVQWTKPNTPSAETLAYFSFGDSLESDMPITVNLSMLQNLSEPSSAREPAEPEFSEGPVALGKALKLSPANLLSISGFKSIYPMELTVSFWVKISEAGFLCSIQNPGVYEEGALGISFKVQENSDLAVSAKIGSSKWVNGSVPTDLLSGGWHHFAAVVTPDPNGTASKLIVSIDGEPCFEAELDGVGPEKFVVFLGASPYEYYLERGGPGATCEIDELLIVGKALAEPNQPL